MKSKRPTKTPNPPAAARPKKPPTKKARTLVGVTIDLCDHEFLADWKPTRRRQTMPLGRFKGCTDARYRRNPTVASAVGRNLYRFAEKQGWGGEWTICCAIGVRAGSTEQFVLAELTHWPSRLDDDGGTEVTIWSVPKARYDAALDDARRTT
jgi:hypothetical protein